MKILYSIVLVFLLIVVVVFSVQNFQTVKIAFAGWSMSLPANVLVIGTYVLGSISGWAVWGLLRRSVQEVSRKKSAPEA